MVFVQKRRRCDKLYFRTRTSSLEGATELKFVSFYSSLHALSDDMVFAQNQKFQILAENHGHDLIKFLSALITHHWKVLES